MSEMDRCACLATSWSCPDCPWVQTAHPLYGWGDHDDRAVEVHQTMLCPAVIPSGGCPTSGCPGDVRYSAPGRRHIEGCTHPLPPEVRDSEDWQRYPA